MPLGETIVRDGRNYYQCSECENDYSEPWAAQECCVFFCQACGTAHTLETDMEDCCPYWCENCETQHSSEEAMNNCCVDLYLCMECGSSYEYEEDAESCCGANVRHPDGSTSRQRASEYPAHIRELVPEYTIEIPALPGRPARTCSVEQELSSGGRVIARMLHEMGMSEHDRVAGYRNDARPGWAFVKEDGSLPHGGGEVVYSRFNLSDPQSGVARLTRAMACIRALKQEGIVTTTRAAGLHIHIGATTLNGDQVFGPGQMAALYEIFSFSESVMFKLASAGWRGHRGDSYSTRLEKFDKSQISAGRIALSSRRHRYFALNFQRLLTAAQQCGCGACISGDWGQCECRVLENGTVEWRVFNATTKPETLHAWLLLAHSMTAAAFEHQLGTLDPNAFEEADPDRDPWILGWILNNCPLANREKSVIIDLAKRAPGLEIDWPDFERHVVNWGGVGQTTLLDAPPEIEDDDDPPSPNPVSDTFAAAQAAFERMNQVVQAQPPRFTWTEGTWTSDNTTMTNPFIVQDVPDEISPSFPEFAVDMPEDDNTTTDQPF